MKEYRLDGLAYYYHGSADGAYEKLQSGFIVGHSLLTAKGIPCAGEGDLKMDGRLKFIITEAEATDGQIMTIGNAQTHVRFRKDPDSYMDEWFAQEPTHHFAMSVGHNGKLFGKIADLLGVEAVTLGE